MPIHHFLVVNVYWPSANFML